MSNLEQYKRAAKHLSLRQKLIVVSWLFWNWKRFKKFHECVIAQWYGDKAFLAAQKQRNVVQLYILGFVVALTIAILTLLGFTQHYIHLTNPTVEITFMAMLLFVSGFLAAGIYSELKSKS